MTKTQDQIVNAVQHAGIIGAGGGGFPTHVKLQAKVDTIIANGSECEPLLTSDRSMMVRKPELLIEGLQIAMAATGAKEAFIGVKAHYHDAVSSLEKALPANGSIKLHLLENYYPAGDEFLLVYEVTGKLIPEGGIPLNVGIVVSNVVTFIQIAEALQGKPVTERPITLAGEFNTPKVIIVPVGTPYEELIKLGGGLKRDDVTLIDGGPMMGKIVNDRKAGIAKTTSGLLAFPTDSFIIRQATKSLSQVMKLSKSACCQCFRCTDLCPRNLLGHELYPHMTMRTIDYNQAEPAKHITSSFLCSQCGVCELIACDFMLLSPRKIYAAYRKTLIAKGMKNPHHQTPTKTFSEFANRKLSIPTVMKKLGITKYDAPLSYEGKKTVNRVRIPLNRHAGAPAIPLVEVGQKVRICDKIAASPANQLGTIYHASIEGKVTTIADDFIEIGGH